MLVQSGVFVRCVQGTVDQLRSRCDELTAREQMYAASWQTDSDVRQQMALEVTSMQVVVEQKNDEIRRLRQRAAELESKVRACRAACDITPDGNTGNLAFLCAGKMFQQHVAHQRQPGLSHASRSTAP